MPRLDKAAGGADLFGPAMVAFFVVSATAAPLVLILALWCEQVVPWWAAACVPLQIVLTAKTGASPALGLPWLLLAPAFALTARRLLDPLAATADRTVPTAVSGQAHSW